MSKREYDKLVERARVKYASADGHEEGIRAVLAEVLRTLQTVTPEMQEAWDIVDNTPTPFENPRGKTWAEEDWLAMLAASPLNPEESSG